MVPVPLVFKRADSRNGPPKSGKTPRNNGEFAVAILKVLPGGKKGQDTLPDLSKYLNQVQRLFTKTAQSNGNIIVGYEPPRDFERLKDENGKVLRTMAEKAGPLNKYILARFMQLYSPPTAQCGVPFFFFSKLHASAMTRQLTEEQCWTSSAEPPRWLWHAKSTVCNTLVWMLKQGSLHQRGPA